MIAYRASVGSGVSAGSGAAISVMALTTLLPHQHGPGQKRAPGLALSSQITTERHENAGPILTAGYCRASWAASAGACRAARGARGSPRQDEHTSELQS